jgi:hypothetical protein
MGHSDQPPLTTTNKKSPVPPDEKRYGALEPYSQSHIMGWDRNH